MGVADGAVTRKAIRLTARPVLAFPCPARPDVAEVFKVQQILVAADFSENSGKLVRYAFDLKKVFDAPIQLLYVIETSRAVEFAVTHGQFAHTVEKMKEWALQRLRSLVPDEFKGDPGAVCIVERGPVSQSIVTAARNIGGCLTILGTHGHGSTHTHLLGTTTDRLLTRTPGPVLILKR